MRSESFWSRFVEKHYVRVLDVSRSYAPRPEWAVDVAQQVFLEFFAKSERFVDDSGIEDVENHDFTPLLLDMARKIALRHWREIQKSSSENIRKMGEVLRQLGENHDDSDDWSEKRNGLEECLETLSPKSRHLIDCYYFNGISVRRLASQLSVSEKAVYKAMFQIRRKLRECIEKNRRRSNESFK